MLMVSAVTGQASASMYTVGFMDLLSLGLVQYSGRHLRLRTRVLPHRIEVQGARCADVDPLRASPVRCRVQHVKAQLFERRFGYRFVLSL